MENTQTNHQLLAIRLRWLNWLAKPIIAIWDFIVESITYVWSIVKLAWAGMKESINYRYWLIATIGGSISVFLVLLFFFIGVQVRDEALFSIGVVLSILPIAWTYAEIASLIQYKKQNGNDIELKSMKSAFGNGLNAIKILALYVATIITMVIAQVVLDLLGLIPAVGPTFLGIIALPLVVASLLIIFSVLILSFGTPILGVHLLTENTVEGSLFSRFTNSSVSLIRIISNKWLDIILVSFPASIFGLLITILPAVLIGSSIALSTGIATVVAEDNVTRLMSVSSVFGNPGFFEYVGGFFLAISISVLIGFVLSFYLASFACTYYSIYTHRNDKSFLKKIFGLLFIFMFISLLFGLLEVI